MKNWFPIILLSLTWSSCTYYAFPPSVKTRYEYIHQYKVNQYYEAQRWRKQKVLKAYVKYDERGNEIEIGEYGEIWRFSRVDSMPDGSQVFVSGHGSYPKKLNTVTYMIYNDSNQVLLEEVWVFKDNKKNYRLLKTAFEYSDNQLVKEIECDRNEEVIREKQYDLSNNVQVEDKKAPIFTPIVRVAGESIDSIRYDTLGRVVEQIKYFNGKFLLRREYMYSRFETLVTELRYDDKPDSLWSISEWRYDLITKQPTRHFFKVIHSSLEKRDEYIYTRKKLLRKVKHYDRKGLTGYTKYRYKLY